MSPGARRAVGPRWVLAVLCLVPFEAEGWQKWTYSSNATQEWRDLWRLPRGPGARRGHTMVLFNTMILMFGGRSNEVQRNHVPKTYEIEDVNGTIDFVSYDKNPIIDGTCYYTNTSSGENASEYVCGRPRGTHSRHVCPSVTLRGSLIASVTRRSWRSSREAGAISGPARRTVPARALEPVAEGDALVAVGGREAAALTADELVGRMRERPLALRFRRAAPPPPAAPAAAAPASAAPPPAAAAPARVELTIPASEKLLGFSVGVRPSERGDCLVVTNVRARSPLDDAGVAPGARLLALNGDDVAHLSLDELTAKARPLANTDRTVVLAVDAPPR